MLVLSHLHDDATFMLAGGCNVVRHRAGLVEGQFFWGGGEKPEEQLRFAIMLSIGPLAPKIANIQYRYRTVPYGTVQYCMNKVRYRRTVRYGTVYSTV